MESLSLLPPLLLSLRLPLSLSLFLSFSPSLFPPPLSTPLYLLLFSPSRAPYLSPPLLSFSISIFLSRFISDFACETTNEWLPVFLLQLAGFPRPEQQQDQTTRQHGVRRAARAGGFEGKQGCTPGGGTFFHRGGLRWGRCRR